LRTLGNILWHFPFFGFISASLTYLVGLLLTVTVIAAPIGLGQMEFGKFLFAPFGHAMISKSSVNVEQNPAWETYSTIIMVLYFPFGLLFATLAVIQVGFLFLSIIGIPVALVVAKSLSTYLNPVGKICVSSAVRDEIDRRKGQAEVTKYLGAGDRGTVTNVLQPVAQPLPPTSATVSPAPADKVERIESAADNSIICRGCGHASSAGNRFCAKCGASIMDVGSPSAMPPPQPKESAHTSAGRVSSAMFSAVVVIGLLIAALVIVIYTKPPPSAASQSLERPAQPTSAPVLDDALTESDFAQHPQWFGTWVSQDEKNSMHISTSPAKLAFTFPVEGMDVKMTIVHEWSNTPGDVQSEPFGYSKQRISPAEISKHYEAALSAFRKDPTDYSVSDPESSRAAIATISPGLYKILWRDSGGDCGYAEYIVDGDHMLEVSECKYGYAVQLYNRRI